MPRPGQPPPSTLRNRNRITNKSRLKVIHGNIEFDQIIPDEDEEKNRLLQIVAGVDQDDAKEHHLQAVLSEAALQAAAGRKSNEKEAAFIPIPEHSGIAENYSTLYPADRWKDPVSYVQSSAVIDEYVAAALADGCTYYMDERDKEWLDRNNEEARGEGTSAQGAVSPSTGRTSTRSAKVKGKEPEEAQPIIMNEDEFELVMGLFEKITQEKTEFLHHSLESDQMHFPEFSEYQEVLSAPLSPSTFAAFSPPSWLPESSRLVRMARIVYPYWKERCLERAGRRIIPVLNFDESDTLNESYVCFRRRETKAVRKTRASQVTSSDKLTRLQSEFEFPLQLAKQLLDREQLKRDSARQSQVVWDLRMKMVELKVKNSALGDKGDDELLVDKERPLKKADSSRVRLPSKQETPAQSSAPTHNIIRPKERHTVYQANIEKMLQLRKDQDQQWEDNVDSGYVSTCIPYPSRLFKYINPPQSSKLSSDEKEPVSEPVPRRPVRLRYGRGGRAYIDRRPPPSRISKRRRLATFSNDNDKDCAMDVDTPPSEDDEGNHRLAERWRFDADDGPPHGPAGSEEQDRMLVDDYDSKYMNFLFEASDYGLLMNDPTIVRTLPDGKKESYVPFRLGVTPPMSIAVTQRLAAGGVPVAQQVHSSVPISQQLKLPPSASANRASPNGVSVAQGVNNNPSQPSAAVPTSQSPPAPAHSPTVMPSPHVTHNGRPAMTMPSVDMLKLATNHNVSAFQPKPEPVHQTDSGNLLSSDPSQHQITRPKSQQQVHAQQATQVQGQTQAQAQAPAVATLHPAYAALANANPAAYNIPHYLYPAASTTGLNNQQMQHLKSVFNAANMSAVQNYNSALFAQMQMPKATNGLVNGVLSVNGNTNLQSFNSAAAAAANNMTLKSLPVRHMQQRAPTAPSGVAVNGTLHSSTSPPRPSSTVNGVQHGSNGSPSPHMNHAAVVGVGGEPQQQQHGHVHVPARTPSANGSRMGMRPSVSPMGGTHVHVQQQPQQMHHHSPPQQQQMLNVNGQMQQQMMQMHSQSSPPPMYSSQSYSLSLSPSPGKMQPVALSGSSPVMHHQQQQQQQQQQVVGNSQGVY